MKVAAFPLSDVSITDNLKKYSGIQGIIIDGFQLIFGLEWIKFFQTKV